jgi:hypothetical protein
MKHKKYAHIKRSRIIQKPKRLKTGNTTLKVIPRKHQVYPNKEKEKEKRYFDSVDTRCAHYSQ